MIFDASALRLPLRLRTELCVVGSGAGGAMAAMAAAEAGLSVTVLEAGGFLPPDSMTQREEQMLPELFWDAGGRTSEDRALKLLQGKGLGGSTLHNLNLCKRIPDRLLAEWIEARGLASLDLGVWSSLYEEVERRLQVTEVPRERWNRHNRLLETACQSLGWRGGGLRHNRSGCLGSGFCMLGCAYDAKNNAAKVLVPRAAAFGAQFLTRCQAVRLIHGSGRVTGVEAVALDPDSGRPLGLVVIEAEKVCLAASATGTAALLLRSRVPAPEGRIGRTLRCHPAVVVAGEFEEPVEAWKGIPQAYECTELLDFEDPRGHRLWILPAFAHPVGFSVMMPGHGAFHRQVMERYSKLAVFTAVLHDTTAGTVEPSGDLGLRIGYLPDPADRAELVLGFEACARLLLAAGACRVLVPTPEPLSISREADLDWIRSAASSSAPLSLTAVHPMGTVPMGDDPRTAAVGSDGKFHHLEGLWIADGSLFPSSIGVPPQLSIYAMGLHVGRALAKI